MPMSGGKPPPIDIISSTYKKLNLGKGVVVSTPNSYYYFQHLKRFTGLNEIC
jgi:hypothetical protein